MEKFEDDFHLNLLDDKTRLHPAARFLLNPLEALNSQSGDGLKVVHNRQI